MRSLLEVSFGLTTFDGTLVGVKLKRETDDAGADRNMESGVVAETTSVEGPPATSRKPFIGPGAPKRRKNRGVK